MALLKQGFPTIASDASESNIVLLTCTQNSNNDILCTTSAAQNGTFEMNHDLLA